MKNSILALKAVLQFLKVEFTKDFLKESLLTHPEPDSLLAISDTLEKYKVENLALKLTPDKLNQVPLPFLAQMKGRNYPYFSCISMVNDKEIKLLNEEGNPSIILRKDFESSWTGIALLIEKTQKSIEPGIDEKKAHDTNIKFLKNSLIFLVIVLIIIGFTDIEDNTMLLLSFSLMGLKITGLSLAFILLWSEVDKDNHTLIDFCSGGRNVDCNEVINSLHLRGSISLSLLAFAYFSSGLFLLVLTGFSTSAIQLMNYLSLSGLAIIPISIYYQKAKIGKWCKLCLWILVVLLSELLLHQLTSKVQDSIILEHYINFGILYLGTILIWLVLKPYIVSHNEINKLKSKINKIYSNREVFNYFISSSRKFSQNPEGLGILIKGNSPKYHVLKVCNPYCAPCAKSHPILEELFETGRIDLQILFAFQSKDEKKLDIIRHLLAIASLGNQKLTQKALDDWYLENEKDYDVFASKFPINGDLHKQEEKIKAMLDWSENENITYTPTIFIDGFELPKTYTIEDLKYLLQ